MTEEGISFVVLDKGIDLMRASLKGFEGEDGLLTPISGKLPPRFKVIDQQPPPKKAFFSVPKFI